METLKAEKRAEGKKAKQIRRMGYVIGNLYGKEIEDSIPVQIEKKAYENLAKQHGKGSQLYLELDGKKYDVLIKDICFNPMKRETMAVDFQALVSNEMVHSVAEIMLHGRDKIEAGALDEMLSEISYKAFPADIQEKVVIDVAELKIGQSIKVKDLDIYKNEKINVLTNPDLVVVSCSAIHVDAEEEAADETEAVTTAETEA